MGNNSPRVNLCTCAGRCWDGNNRQSLLNGLVLTCTSGNIVPVIALVACHYGDALCRVDRASAAKTDDEVALLVTAQRSCLHYMLLDRVGKNLIKDNALNIILLKIAYHFI